MAIEIVSFTIKNGDFPVRYVRLPEGRMVMTWEWFIIGFPTLRNNPANLSPIWTKVLKVPYQIGAASAHPVRNIPSGIRW